MNGATARAHKPVTINCSSKEPTVAKYLAVIACVASLMLMAGAGANACGDGGEELLASPEIVQLETNAPQPAPKDQWTAPQGGK